VLWCGSAQLACARISSPEGKDYLAAMSAAANFAWVNRASMTFLVRQTFAKAFNTTPDDLDMHVIYGIDDRRPLRRRTDHGGYCPTCRPLTLRPRVPSLPLPIACAYRCVSQHRKD
jgi:hypothetical protein